MHPKTMKIAILGILLIIFVQAAAAKELIITEEEPDNVYFIGNTVLVNNSLYGDLYTITGSLEVNSPVNRDVSAITETAKISNLIGGSLRIITSRLSLDGHVFDDLMVLSSEVEISDNSKIGGDAYILSRKAVIDAEIEGRLKAKTDSLTLNSVVKGDSSINTKHLVLGENALILGDLNITGVTQIDESKVTGTVTYIPEEPTRARITAFILGNIAFLVTILITGLLLYALLGGYTKNNIKTMSSQPFLSFIIGFLSMIIIPFISFLLMITIIGIPLSLLMLVAYALIWLVAITMACAFIGTTTLRIATRRPGFIVSLIIGVILYLLLLNVPYVGWIIIAILVITSFGATIKSAFYKALVHKRKLVRPVSKSKRKKS